MTDATSGASATSEPGGAPSGPGSGPAGEGAAKGPRGAGGTPGGIGTFFAGTALAAAGGYLILNQVNVYGTFHFWGIGARGGFGLVMLPLLAGIGFLFFHGKSLPGRILTWAGAAIVLAAVLMNLNIAWRTTSLYNTLLMFGMFAAGLGLVFRSLRPAP